MRTRIILLAPGIGYYTGLNYESEAAFTNNPEKAYDFITEIKVPDERNIEQERIIKYAKQSARLKGIAILDVLFPDITCLEIKELIL